MIQITNEAAKELKELLEKECKLDFGLRISYAGNGCSGPQYSLRVDETAWETKKSKSQMASRCS